MGASGQARSVAVKAADQQDRLARMRESLRNHLLHLAGKGGKRLNLMMSNVSYVILENFDFSRAAMVACNFSYSNLEGAHFRDADLTNSLFIRTNLVRADFSGAILNGVRFHYADAQEATLDETRMKQGSVMIYRDDVAGGGRREQTLVQETDLSNSNFEGASLRGADMSGCRIRNANLKGADLTGADLKGADLSGSTLAGAVLTDAVLTDVTVENTIFDVTPETINALQMNEGFRRFLDIRAQAKEAAELHRAWVDSGGKDGKRADFAGRNLRGIDLSGLMLATVSFAGSDLSGAKLTNAVLAAADLSGAVIQYADLSGADIRGANFAEAQVQFSSFQGVDATPLALRNGGSLPTRFDRASLRNCDLRAPTLTATMLSGAKVADCEFDGG
ncbi:pentapeptide repeat-containing protein [Azospirillum sp.]|uniref:pentapeptide repeat-containing protein n=1 Tax=Azospirillum sp. TaxID=34012 RepID=UPI003D704BCB